MHDFIDIQSESFAKILAQCSFVVYPSCSEGGSPSVLNVIGNGGLIPIITKETTISTGAEIWIEGFDYVSIDKAIKKSQRLTFMEIKNLQNENLRFVTMNNSQEKYYDDLKKNILKIIEISK